MSFLSTGPLTLEGVRLDEVGKNKLPKKRRLCCLGEIKVRAVVAFHQLALQTGRPRPDR